MEIDPTRQETNVESSGLFPFADMREFPGHSTGKSDPDGALQTSWTAEMELRAKGQQRGHLESLASTGRRQLQRGRTSETSEGLTKYSAEYWPVLACEQAILGSKKTSLRIDEAVDKIWNNSYSHLIIHGLCRGLRKGRCQPWGKLCSRLSVALVLPNTS